MVLAFGQIIRAPRDKGVLSYPGLKAGATNMTPLCGFNLL
jgi:hypothetical protein